MKRLTTFEGMLELSVYLRCSLPLPPQLPIQSSFLELSEKETLKAKWHETSCIPAYVFEHILSVKGDDHDKSRNPRSTVQSSFLKLSEMGPFKENRIGKVQLHNLTYPIFRIKRSLESDSCTEWTLRKVGILDLPYKVHWHQCCAMIICAKLYIEYALEPSKDWHFEGMLELSVYLRCSLPLPPHLRFQSFLLGAAPRMKLWMGRCGGRGREHRKYYA